MGEKRTVPVQILGHEYRIRTDSDPDGMERVASLVHEVMDRIRERTGNVDSLEVAVMAALNLANDLLAERQAAEASGSPERIRHLVDDVEAILRDPTPAS